MSVTVSYHSSHMLCNGLVKPAHFSDLQAPIDLLGQSEHLTSVQEVLMRYHKHCNRSECRIRPEKDTGKVSDLDRGIVIRAKI